MTKRDFRRTASAGFGVKLAALGLAAFAVRLLYGHLAPGLTGGGGDDAWYHLAANHLADGYGFIRPVPIRVGESVLAHPVPTAFHLPLFPFLLAAGSKLGASSYAAHQAIGCALGAGTVVGIGVLGRLVGGARVGLVAAALAVAYLPLVANDALLESESLEGVTVVLVLIAAVRALERPSARRAAILGALVGLAALDRTEALLFVPLLAIPLVRAAPPGRLRMLGALAGACLVVIAPWVARNLATFQDPVLLTTGDGSVFAGANCPSVYSGPLAGAWDQRCLFVSASEHGLAADESVQSGRWRTEGLDFASTHLSAVPGVLALRVLRTWSLYGPRREAALATFANGHVRALEAPRIWSSWLALALAVLGAVGLRRRRGVLAVLLAPAVLVTATSVIGYGAPRFRQPADVAIVVLAALALCALVARRRRGRGEEEGEPQLGRPASSRSGTGAGGSVAAGRRRPFLKRSTGRSIP